ncbi:MAG: hypothetical protein K0Q72_3814 [Armatimonadetes bacterium]|nr:hypothetical protein [Armatimonadota bacterium]
MEFRPIRACALGVAAVAAGGGLAGALPASAAKGKATLAPIKAPAPTGRITYQFDVDTPMGKMAGLTKLIWIDNGKKFRQETDLSGSPKGAPAGASPTLISSWSFGDGTNIYISQPMMGRTVYRMPMPKGGAAGGGGSVIGAPPVGGAAQGKLVGKGKVLGRECEIRQVSSAKLWMWMGLALKMENTGDGKGPKMVMTATKLEMPYKAPGSMFKVPAGYTVTDQMPGMSGAPGGGAPTIRKGSQ